MAFRYLPVGRFDAEEQPDRRLVRASGEIDLSNARELLTSLESGDPTEVVVDLTDVSYIDSAGIRSLATAADALGRRGGRLCLVVPPRSRPAATLALAGFTPDWMVDSLDDL